MITKEITICGKQVTLAYCFATEINFKKDTNKDIKDFIQEVASCIQAGRLPDSEFGIAAIMATLSAYYKGIKQEIPFTKDFLETNLESVEYGNALGTVVNIYAEFYRVPNDEPKDKETKGAKKRKNG